MLNNHLVNEVVPLNFHLSQNYPNPFYDKTIIKYCLAYKVKVKLEIFNTDGELIELLLNEEQKAGTYEVEFDAGNLLGGLYLYRLKASSGKQGLEDFEDSKEFKLIK